MSLRAVTGPTFLLVFACLAPGMADAGEAVQLRVGCVLASNTGQEVDKRLVELRPRFARLFRYTSYNLVKEKRERVTIGGRMIFEVPGGRYLLVLPKQSTADGTVLLKVVLLEGDRPIVNTSISLKKRGTFLVGGPQNNDGALILAIAADDLAEDQ
jgi:hypothetical protein